MKGRDYKELLLFSGHLEQAKSWLLKNPPPEKFVGGRYAWAYTEMMILPRWLWRLLY